MATGGPIRPSTSQVTDSHHQPQDKTTDQSNYLSPAISQAIEPWPQVDFYNNTSIQFEEYHYWADLTREAEKSTRPQEQGLFGLFKRKSHEPREEPAATLAGDSKKEVVTDTTDHSQNIADTLAISDSEWNNARGAMRTATWGSIFYLITTDVLGPYNVPWAISRMGFGPGFALYTVFGGLALYSSIQLWQMFIGLDSTRYPLRNYGDMAFRVFGKWARLLVNSLQTFQFFLMVALITESNGQSLAQMAAGKNGTGFLCFIVAEAITCIIGLVLGQIRTLQRLGFLANAAVWLNVFVIIMTMIVVHKYPPNFAAAEVANHVTEGPIIASANWPEGLGLSDYMAGVMNCVFAYGGAMLFTELMAEMKRPMDFWKSLVCAELFIYAVYITMGMVVYSAQGQFTYPLAYQGIPASAYVWQTLGNAVAYTSGLIAMALYGNIGIKIIYASVLQDVFKFPALDKKMGKIIWALIVPVYWGLAFVVAAAVPQIANLFTLVGALCILQFQYSFPPLLKVGYNVQKDAVLPDESFNPVTGEVQRLDHGMKRWVRGFMKQPVWNTFDVLYGLSALSLAGLGLWAAVINMKAQFAQSGITPFSCTNPAG